MPKLSNRLAQLPSYPMAEIPAIKRRLLQQGVDLIDVGAGDADFAPPDIAVEALSRAAREPAMSRYAFQIGLPAFREAAAAYLQRRFKLTVDPFTELHPLLGSKEGIANLSFTVLDPGDVAIVPEPGYAVYHGATVLAGATPHLVPLTPRTDFLLEMEELPADVVRRAKLVYLNYPNNPTAAIAPRKYLERTVAFCRRHDILIVYDNPYCEITFDGYVAPSIFEIAGAKEVAVEFHSLSKSFCMTGWRLGYCIAPRELTNAIRKVHDFLSVGAPHPLQVAGAVALKFDEAYYTKLREDYRARRKIMTGYLSEAGFEFFEPEGAYYIMTDITPFGARHDVEFSQWLTKEIGVATVPGSSFYLPPELGRTQIRFMFAKKEDTLRAAGERLLRIRGRGPHP